MSNISVTSTVKHRTRTAEAFRVSMIAGGDNIDRVVISGDEGEVFTGTVAQAKAAGFAFDGEDFTTCATPYLDLPEAFIVGMAEEAYLDPTSGAADVQRIAQFAVSAHAYIRTLWVERDTLRRQVAAAKANATLEMDQYKAQVRESAIEHAENESHCNPGLNAWLESLGLDPVSAGWTVEVSYDYHTLASVDVNAEDADDEDAAIEYVKEHIELEVESGTVRVSVTVRGSDDSDTDSIEVDVDGDAINEGWLDDIEFSYEATAL